MGRKINIKAKHSAYAHNIKTGNIRILFRDTYIRFIHQHDGFRTEWRDERIITN